jgi:hypothetical protein
MVTVRSAEIVMEFTLRVEFSTGEQRVVNIEPLLHGPIFEPLRQNPALFHSVRVDEELGTIVWDNGADIDPNVLYGTHCPAWMEADSDLLPANQHQS